MIGDLVFARFPLADRSAFKQRACLVVSEADDLGDFEVLKISSKHLDDPARLRLLPDDFLKGGLPLESCVVLHDVTKVNRKAVTRYLGRLKPNAIGRILKKRLETATRRYSRLMHRSNRPGNDALRSAFRPDLDSVPYAGRVFTEDEVEAAVSSTLDFWLTLGPEGEAFERELADFLGVKKSIAVNSGSSANLVAFAALTSHKLPEEQRIRPGDEVITCAAGFPTTVAPIIQNGAVPVFLDNDPRTGNADFQMLEAAYRPGVTKAVMMAHALGNPFDLATAVSFCQRHGLWLIEDNCDALGCTYTLPVEEARSLGLDHLIRLAEKNDGSRPAPRIEKGMLTAYTGTFGDLSTQSFYPPHHLTMGEGGAVNIVREMRLKVLVESFRDWGRDCWCPSGKDNTCNKRFGWQLGELPEGYDHKYIYSHLGYNLKPLDPQAAIGRVQIRKLPGFIEARKRNWETLRRGLAGLEPYFDFALPTHSTAWNAESGFEWNASGHRTECSWFGFMMLLRPEAPFTRTEFARHLEDNKIGNRMLFGGNLLRQPAFVDLKRSRPDMLRVIPANQDPIHPHPGADRVMSEAIFIGVYPGLSEAQLGYVVETIKNFVNSQAAVSSS